MAKINKSRKTKALKKVVTKPVNPYTVVFQRLSPKYLPKLLTVWRAIFAWLKIFLPTLAVGLAMLIANFMKHIDGARLNGDITFFSEFRLPIIATTLTAGLFNLIYVLAFRKNHHAALMASLMAILASSNYDERFHTFLPYVKGLFPLNLEAEKYYSLLFLIFQLLVYGLVALGLLLIIKNLKVIASQVYTLLLVAAIYILIATAWPFIGYVRATRAQQNYRPAPLATIVPASAKQAAKPDIYYFVFDDYTSGSVLKNNLGYDNSAFTNDLRDQGFYVNDSAYSAYPYTSMSVGSTMEGRYLDNLQKTFGSDKYQSETPYFQSTRYSPVAQELKKLGYAYDLIGSWYAVSDKGPLADNFFYQFNSLNVYGKKIDLAEFDGTKISNSLFATFLKEGVKLPGLAKPLLSYTVQDYVSLEKYQRSALTGLINAPSSGGRFIFTHVLIPHGPFVFNADGSVSPFSAIDNVGKSLTQKYIDQVKFVSSQIKDIVNQIKTTSAGKAVIVIQSDEGVEPDSLLQDSVAGSDMTTWTDSYLQAKYGILAAYYLPGVSPEEIQKGANSANIFRLILNHYFGYDLPLLPICHFGFDQGRSKTFLFADITNRLSADPDPRCQTIYN